LGILAAPGVAIIGDRDRGLRFYGAPDGYELVSLMQGIQLASTADSGLSDESRARVATLTGVRNLQIFSTPTCPHCPRAVRLGWQLAIESDHITATAVSAVEFPDLVRRFRVTGVPKTVINEHADILGAVPEAEFVETVVNG
jgi:glutaredoxin-like protein